MGKPVDYEKRAREQEAFLAEFAKTGIAKTAATAAGMFPIKHYRWLKDDPGYAERFATLEQQTRDLAEANRKPHAKGYRVTGARAEAQRRRQEAFLAALGRTGILQDAADGSGVHKGTYNYWVRTDPDFAARAQRVLAEAEGIRRETVAQRASDANRAVWSDPGRREAQRERQQHAWTPEMRAAAGQRNRDRMADPEYAATWLQKSRRSREFTACENPSYFDEINTPDKAYWLGFIGADGCVTGFKSGSLRLVIKLARKDRDHLAILYRTLGAHRPIRDTDELSIDKVRRPCSTLDVCSPQLVNALVSHGITPRKTHTYEQWHGPADLMPHYWRGVIDGDGSICLSDHDMKLCIAGTESVAEGFRAWAQSVCGTKAVPHKRPGSRNFWTLNLGGTNQVLACLRALYDDAPVALTRKKALADLALHGKPLQAGLF